MTPPALLAYWKPALGIAAAVIIGLWVLSLRHDAATARKQAAQAQVALGVCHGSEAGLRASLNTQNAALATEKRRADAAQSGWDAAQAGLARRDADLAALHKTLTAVPRGNCPSPAWAKDAWERLQ